jgi:hypothetical protein
MGRRSTVIRTRSPASTRRKTSAVWLRSSRTETSPSGMTSHMSYSADFGAGKAAFARRLA